MSCALSSSLNLSSPTLEWKENPLHGARNPPPEINGRYGFIKDTELDLIEDPPYT